MGSSSDVIGEVTLSTHGNADVECSQSPAREALAAPPFGCHDRATRLRSTTQLTPTRSARFWVMVRVHRWRVLFLSLGATALLMSTAIGAAASTPATTSSVLKAARAAILRQTGVHLVESFISNSVSLRFVVDLGTKSGQETAIFGLARLRFRLTPTYLYVDGNSSGLTTLFGLTATQVQKVGHDWISVPHGTSEYARVKSALSVSRLVRYLPPANGTTLSTTVTGGAQLYVLEWTTAATSSLPKRSNTMVFSAVGATLPAELIVATAGSYTTTKYSKWGEHLDVRAPPVASTISYSKVRS